MKTNIFLSAVCVLICCISCADQKARQASYNQGINIIPKPQSLTVDEGVFRINGKTGFYAPTPESKAVMEYFTAKIKAATGLPVALSDRDADKNTVSLVLDAALDVNNEGYYLTVTPQKATVRAKTLQGLFYGMQTFMQLLPAEIENSANPHPQVVFEAPCVTVKDEPRFEYRGIHLDPSRHFMSVADVKKYLELVSLFKINKLHFHLTDDQAWRIEIKKYPRLQEIASKRIEGEGFEYGGYYTQDEIREIVKYASDRFITVIPEIELPGHEMAAIAAYPELACKAGDYKPRIIWGVEDIVLCAGKEHVFEFLEDVFKEVIDLFPSEYIHIGGDECPKVSWQHCPLCQKRIREEGLTAKDGHSAEERLQSYFVQRIEKMLAKYGKKIIGWDEILEGGLAPTATVMSWRGEEGGIAAANLAHDVIMTPSSNGMYIDQFQGDSKIEPVSIGGLTTLKRVYDYNPTPDTLVKVSKDHYIKGVQCNTWSEYFYTEAIREYRIFPRIIALSEIAWTELENKDYQDFERRINNAYVRLDAYNINYHIPQPEQPFGSCNYVAFTDKATLTFTTSRPYKIVYTLDGAEPTASSAVYDKPIETSENITLKIATVLPSGKMSKTRVITVEKQPLAPAAAAIDAASLKEGLKVKTAEGYFLKTSDTKDITAWKEQVIPNLGRLTQLNINNNEYAAVGEGFIDIPEDGVYFFSSDLEEVWIDGKLLIDNGGEVKRFSRRDKSAALAKGLHAVKAVHLGHIIGGWPSWWNNGSIRFRRADAERWQRVKTLSSRDEES